MGRRLRPLVIALAILAVPTAAAAPAPTPPWLSHNGARFALETTGDWELAGVHAP